jgi:hypothetical protein
VAGDPPGIGRRVPVKIRLSLALLGCVVGTGVIPGTAAADRPVREEFSPVGDEWLCGETSLTITGGTVVFRTHVHELPSGLFRVIDVGVNRDVTATDEEGTLYRVVGVVHGNFTTPDPEEEGDEIGFFHAKLTFIGPGGLLGTLDFLERTKPNGDEVFRNKSTCDLVG